MLSRSIRGNPRLALAAVGLATFMTSLDNTVVNVALPSIQRDLRLSLGGLEWTASVYVLVFASLLLAGGRLADLYGRKRLFLAGTAVFTAASLVSGLARSEAVLLAGRVAQGAGAALAAPTALAIISAMFPGERERGRAVGAWSGVTALAVAIGPLAGGFISQHWQWGWIFFINVPLGILTLALGAAAISESRQAAATRSLDVPGLASSTVALAALAYALIQGHAAGWTSPVILASLAASGAAGIAFCAAESRSPAPMVDLALFRSRVFSGGTATLVLWGFGVLGVYFFTPLYLQVVLGFSPTRAGLAFVPMALLMAVSATLAPLMSNRAGANRTVAAGMVLVAAGLAATALLGQHASFAALMVPLAAVGIGSGLTMPVTAAILGVLPQAQAGVAGGILNAAREASGLLGVTVIGAILTARQGAALAAGATPHAAFLAGYSAGLAAAAALVLAGGVIALRTMPGRAIAAEVRPQPGSVQADPPRIPAAAIPAAAIPAVAASGAPRYAAVQSRPFAEPSRAAA
jgi:EmrB/QacA subfamily drug resistance transporter